MEDSNMEIKPLVTVIIPIYNVEKYLAECIESVINQSYKNLEIILVDDGSTDSSGLICENYKKKDNRIRIIHKPNGGLSDARNAGLDVSKGGYITFVDSDDYIEKKMIEELYDACKQYDAEISICGRRQFWEDGRTKEMFCVREVKQYTKEAAIEQILLNGETDSAAWDKMYKAKLFKQMRYPVGVLHEDLDVTSRLFANSDRIIKIPYIGYNYRMRVGSITKQGFTSRKMDLLYQTEKLCDYVYEEYPELSLQANKFYCFTLTNLMTLLISSNRLEYSNEIKTIVELSQNALLANLRNRYLSVKDKIRMGMKIIQLKF